MGTEVLITKSKKVRPRFSTPLILEELIYAWKETCERNTYSTQTNLFRKSHKTHFSRGFGGGEKINQCIRIGEGLKKQ